MASLLFSPNVANVTLVEQPSLQHFSQTFSSKSFRTFKSSRVTPSALVNRSSPSLVTTMGIERENEFLIREQKPEPQEDPRLLRDIWRDIQGRNDWEGLLDPMNSHLRREVIRYGEFAQSCYDSFDFDPHSRYCGSCKYPRAEFFEKMDMSHYGYDICRYVSCQN